MGLYGGSDSRLGSRRRMVRRKPHISPPMYKESYDITKFQESGMLRIRKALSQVTEFLADGILAVGSLGDGTLAGRNLAAWNLADGSRRREKWSAAVHQALKVGRLSAVRCTAAPVSPLGVPRLEDGSRQICCLKMGHVPNLM